jgi:hypothetical protein
MPGRARLGRLDLEERPLLGVVDDERVGEAVGGVRAPGLAVLEPRVELAC